MTAVKLRPGIHAGYVTRDTMLKISLMLRNVLFVAVMLLVLTSWIHITNDGSRTVQWLSSRLYTSQNIQDLNREGPRPTPTIPHIIHQAWDSYDVPKELADWIKSWADHNPLWEYWLWTPADVRALLTEKYPSYLSLYNEYHYNIFRCDAMRYFIMDTFGGFYVDLDMECFKPLDPWTYNHSCVLSHETYEHPFLLHSKDSPNVMTTILASRPGHPFFKQVISSLTSSFHKFPTDVLQGTGPFFLDRIFRKYNQSGRAIMASFVDKSPKDPKGITVVPPAVFLPSYDPIMQGGFIKKCRSERVKMNKLALETCDKLEERNYTNRPLPESYANHHWVHIFLAEQKWRKKETVPIKDIIPRVKSYRATRS